MTAPTLVILAAGIGSRYGGLKQLDGFGPSGETLMDYAVYDAARSGFGKVVLVVRGDMEEEFRARFEPRWTPAVRLATVVQELDRVPAGFTVPPGRSKPWGTAHAVLMAAPEVDTPFVVINADDFYGRGSYARAAEFFRRSADDPYGIVGFELQRTLSAHGTVSRGVCETDAAGHLRRVTERTEIERRGDAIAYRDEHGDWQPLAPATPVSMNMITFPPAVFPLLERYFADFLAARGGEPRAEFFLPLVLTRVIDEGVGRVRVIPTDEQWFGVTYREDRDWVRSSLRRLVDRGVYPSCLWP